MLNKIKIKNFQAEKKWGSNDLPGLTLIELLVSISIIALVSSAFILNYRSSNHRSDLVMAAQMVVADIHQAQNNALGLLNYGEQSPAGGWGVHFDLSKPDQYYIFADLEGPGEPGHRIFTETSEGVESLGARKVILPRDIELIQIKSSLSGNNNNSANIIFIPPDPKVAIKLGNVPVEEQTVIRELYVYLKEKPNNDEDSFKIIKINTLGLVEVIK